MPNLCPGEFSEHPSLFLLYSGTYKIKLLGDTVQHGKCTENQSVYRNKKCVNMLTAILNVFTNLTIEVSPCSLL